MAFSPGDITKEHILSAIEKIEAEQIELIPSTRWDVVINGKSYPPKEVMRYAHEAMNGEKLWENIGGGEPTNKYLRKFGFVIKDKLNQTEAIQKFLDKKVDWFQKILDAEEFFFQKGQDELKKWLQLELSDEIKNRILKLSADYKLFQEEAQNDVLIKEVLDQINAIVAYCDSHAYKKDEYNKYNDKRILANAGVYQNAWTKKIVEYKFDRKEENNSVYNALDYLKDPKNGCTVLSENHRKMISENGWDIEYNAETFVEDLKSYFSEFNIKLNNPDNYTYALSCIVYEFQHKWKDEIVGLMASDSTGWQDSHIELTKDKHSIVWNSKKPTGGIQTLKALRNIIEEKGRFCLYCSISNKVEYRASVIDFAESQHDLIEKNWPGQHGEIEFYQSNFSDYTDGDKKASIIFLIESIEKIAPKPISEFKFYKSQRPKQYKLSPISFDPFEDELNGNTNTIKPSSNMNIPLNQILYGPPGTGKTYKTINKAVEIVDPGYKANSRTQLVEYFNKLKEEGKIEFVTFHQSFSYEDFIEGIKPVMSNEDENGEVKYEIRPGIFKRLCSKARGLNKISTSKGQTNFFEASYYKMSLGGKNKPHIHDWCINNNKLALGWGGDADLSHLKEYVNWSQFKTAFQEKYPALVEESRYHIQASFIFLKMKKGDVVLVSKGNKIIDAIGVISDNEYNYDPNQEFDYCHYRNVKWLATDLNASPELFVSKNISQQTIYEFYDADVKKEYFNLKFNKNEEPEGPDNYVLVIDEINRGNIAAIFGELITLIESDKRLGEENELTATLPYSGKEEKPFGVPPNLYIIGTMNTADRSVEALDAALRRRFSFEEMPPNTELPELKYEFEGIWVNKMLETLNKRLEKLLDKDHLIGHSFFIKRNNDNAEITIRKAFYDKIIPLLQEYFYGDFGKMGLVLGNGFVRLKEDMKADLFANFEYSDKEVYTEREIYEILANPNRGDFVIALKHLMNIKVEQEQ